MAGSGFPQRKASGAGGMTSPGAGQEVLDGPPPSPVMANASMPQPGQQPQMPSFAQMSQPLTAGTPGRAGFTNDQCCANGAPAATQSRKV